MEDVRDELQDEVPTCRVADELDVLGVDVVGEEVLDG